MKHRPSWSRVPKLVREEVQEALMREQGFICCYCEGRVALEDSHVEHFRPRDRKKGFGALELDYANLFCSCVRDQSAGEPRHCGHRKGSWFVEHLFVSPLSSDCETRFTFTGNGEIHAAPGDVAGETTIRKLGLDLPKLNALRAAAVDGFLGWPESDVRRRLSAAPGGRTVEYYSTIKQVLTE